MEYDAWAWVLWSKHTEKRYLTHGESESPPESEKWSTRIQDAHQFRDHTEAGRVAHRLSTQEGYVMNIEPAWRHEELLYPPPWMHPLEWATEQRRRIARGARDSQPGK